MPIPRAGLFSVPQQRRLNHVSQLLLPYSWTRFERTAWVCVRIQGLRIWTFGSNPSTAISLLCTWTCFWRVSGSLFCVCDTSLDRHPRHYPVGVFYLNSVACQSSPDLGSGVTCSFNNLENLDFNFQIRTVLWEHCMKEQQGLERSKLPFPYRQCVHVPRHMVLGWWNVWPSDLLWEGIWAQKLPSCCAHLGPQGLGTVQVRPFKRTQVENVPQLRWDRKSQNYVR